jgi:hypothetical protein
VKTRTLIYHGLLSIIFLLSIFMTVCINSVNKYLTNRESLIAPKRVWDDWIVYIEDDWERTCIAWLWWLKYMKKVKN